MLEGRLGVAGTLAALCALAGLGACGDDSGGAGCTTDAECKGDRICVSGACVDPEDAMGDAGGGGSSGSSGDSGGGGDSGSGGDSGGGGDGGTGGREVIDDPELEQACILDCEARNAASCEMNVGSLDQCMAQCLVIDESSQGFCLEEMTARYACLASGGYTCVSGYPQPQATCINEGTALSTCSQMTPCRAYCEVAQGDCAPADGACFDTCTETQADFEDAICGVYYQQLLSCWTRDVACEDGMPAVGNCGGSIAGVADCVARRNHQCDGFCWAAELLGCGSDDCLSTCMTRADEGTCGYYYERVLDCAIGDSRDLLLACEGDVPTPDATACQSEIQQYDDCMAMP